MSDITQALSKLALNVGPDLIEHFVAWLITRGYDKAANEIEALESGYLDIPSDAPAVGAEG